MFADLSTFPSGLAAAAVRIALHGAAWRVSPPLCRLPACAPQVRINALVNQLPPDALRLSAGEVQRVSQPYIDGAFQVFHVSCLPACLPT